MIHILDYKTATFDFNPDIILQYVDVPRIFQKLISETDFVKNKLKKDGSLVYKKIDEKDRFTLETFYEYVDSNIDIQIIVCNIEIFKKCFTHTNLFFDKISKKYPKIKFIVSSDETFFKYSNSEYQHKNVFYILNSILNPYSFINNIDSIKNLASYYITNNYLQADYSSFIFKMFNYTNTIVKDKKYNFYNGVHKPHRLKCYELVKNNDLLPEGYFSYVDFAYQSKNTDLERDFIDFLDLNDKEEYYEYLSKFEIPLHYDTTESDPNIFVAFLNPPQTSFQSYICITTETTFQSGQRENDLVLSEKSFKPFFGFNIPLIVGIPTAIQYLKDLGFDLFEDLFDISPKNNKVEIFEQFDKNLKVIKNMSKLELHNFYVDNIQRIEHNFNLLTNRLKEKDIENINNFLRNG